MHPQRTGRVGRQRIDQSRQRLLATNVTERGDTRRLHRDICADPVLHGLVLNLYLNGEEYPHRVADYFPMRTAAEAGLALKSGSPTRLWLSCPLAVCQEAKSVYAEPL